MSFFEELKRRNVIRVGIAYVVAGWVLLQVADLVLENIGAPAWVIQAMMLFVVLGFIAALVIAWAYELTPEGVKRERDIDRSQSITHATSRKLDRIIIGFLVLAVAYFVWEARFAEKGSEPFSPVTSEQAQIDEEGNRALTPAAPAEEAEPSIAVLPFADMSPEGDQEYFSDGISEELLNLLVRVEGLKVASRTSSFAFKGSKRGIAEIAEELKVEHVLEGSVRKAENRVRITAQLIDTKTDRHLWSDTYDRELVDIFAIQDEIANAIVGALQTELGILQEAAGISVVADTENLDAYELYLKGRALFIARDRLPECIALLEQAVQLDPGFARAWETLGAVYSVAPSWQIRDRDYVLLSKEASEQALEINPELSTPWAVLGVYAMNIERDFIRGIQFMDRAIQNDPKNATAYLWRSIFQATLGFFEAAVADSSACLELDPDYENCRRYLARQHLLAGNTEIAMELFQEGAEHGFFGSNEPFAYELMRRGNRIAVALGMWQWQKDDLSFPAKTVLDALEFPDRDHSAGLARYLGWLETSGANLNDSLSHLVTLGGFEYARPTDFGNSWIWGEGSGRFRQSEYFKPLVNKLGLPAYWRERSFPPFCHPLGDNDFECELP